MDSMTSDEFLHFVARYKFTLAFENAVCEDYITEKLWRPLTVGSVPIYWGSPSVQVSSNGCLELSIEVKALTGFNP